MYMYIHVLCMYVYMCVRTNESSEAAAADSIIILEERTEYWAVESHMLGMLIIPITNMVACLVMFVYYNIIFGNGR